MIVHSSLMEEAKQSIEILRAARYDIRVVEQLPSGLHDGNDLSKEPAWRMMITPDEMSPLPAYIVHSSGSTGMPKVSPFPQRAPRGIPFMIDASMYYPPNLFYSQSLSPTKPLVTTVR